jgi:hypothetical protein
LALIGALVTSAFLFRRLRFTSALILTTLTLTLTLTPALTLTLNTVALGRPVTIASLVITASAPPLIL